MELRKDATVCSQILLHMYTTLFDKSRLFFRNWIFDISPSSNSKSRYKVRHEAIDAA